MARKPEDFRFSTRHSNVERLEAQASFFQRQAVHATVPLRQGISRQEACGKSPLQYCFHSKHLLACVPTFSKPTVPYILTVAHVNCWQTFVRLIPPVHDPLKFNAKKAVETDGKGPPKNSDLDTIEAHNWEMYTARLICVFELDVLCRDPTTQQLQVEKCRLAYIQYLDTCNNNQKSTIDGLQETDRVQGEAANKRQQYEVVEYERILGPEYLIPCFEDPVTMQLYHERIEKGRDIRKFPLSDKEVWRRMTFGRRIGGAHATPVVVSETCGK